jgi:hypothetical protein
MRSATGGIVAALIGLSAPFIIVWARHHALRHRPLPGTTRPVTDAELARVRWLGRLSIWLFVLFWVVSLSLIAATALLEAAVSIERGVMIGIFALAAASIAFHLSIRCPVCRYRLGYQRTIGTPARCERCGAQFR